MQSERREITVFGTAVLVFLLLLGGVVFGQERGQRERPQGAPAAQATPREPAAQMAPRGPMNGEGRGSMMGQGMGEGRGSMMGQGQGPQGPPPGRGPGAGPRSAGPRPDAPHAVPRPVSPGTHPPRRPYGYRGVAPRYPYPTYRYGNSHITVYWPGFFGWYSYAGEFPYEPYYPYESQYGLGSVKFKGCQRLAEVYVDGGFAGVVDQYDGMFEHIAVPIGNHSILVRDTQAPTEALERVFNVYVQSNKTTTLRCGPPQ